MIHLCVNTFPVFHRMTESPGLERASKDAQVQTPAQTWSTTDDCSSWVLNIFKDGNSTTFLGNLFQCWITCSVKKCSLTSGKNFLNLNLCPLLLVSLDTSERRLALLSLFPSLGVWTHTGKTPGAFSPAG